MALSTQRIDELRALCQKFRIDLIRQLHSVQTGHPGGSLSVCEILTVLYFEKAKVTPASPCDPSRDRIILSKGHAAPMLYRILAEKGFFPHEDFAGLRRFGCHLQGHPCSKHTPGVEIPSGPLGLGLSAGIGMALSLRLSENPARVYVVLGDGELNEGCVWEAAMSANKYKLDNLTAIVDYNHIQLDGTSDDIMPMGDLAAKWRAFGWEVVSCDGHNIAAISNAIDICQRIEGRPAVILAESVKGKGVSFMEGKNSWHGSPINDEQYAVAMEELGGTA
jgi:Transketolase, N-terminal subunit